MELRKIDWLGTVREIGLILGFVSIFLVWRVGRPEMFTANYTLAAFLGPSLIWDLLQTWPFQLGVVSGLLFLGGCIALLFTRWGVIAQILGLIAFFVFYLTFPYNFQYTALGIGFYIAVLSAVICLIIDFGVKSKWLTKRSTTELKQ